MSENIISTKNLRKIYQSLSIKTSALNNISLNIEKGDFTAIMGPSGCGKSTLLNILGLLDSPTSGEYYFLGNDVSKQNEGLRSKLRKGKIGFIFQNFNLIESLNVYENIELPLMYLKVISRERKKKVINILKYMNIENLAKRYPYQISGGEQQRVSLSRAIIFEPQLILADEPTGNLDNKNSKNIMELLSKFNGEGRTIVLVTHDPECSKYCRNVINILDGSIVH
ncbi:MAG: ABC transporter ATP-binding protein [Bacteroidetes bacterium]|nr:MAG: ABC transporter ATP-binding protein [Bacteroidota bacterium]